MTKLLFKRINEVLKDLRIDGAITETQLQRHYELRDLGRPVKSTCATLFPSASLDTYQHCKIYALSKKVIEMSHGELLHLIGTAEMRHALGVPSDLWVSSAQRQGAGLVPDALWATPDGEIAIEFDTGTYRYKLIDAKLKAFEKYAGIVWGTPSSARAARIKELYPHVQVLCVAHLEHLGPDSPNDVEARRFGASV